MVVGVIPARLHSVRFPEKILARISGKPMIVHVAERAQKATQLDEIILAVDDEKTVRALEPYDFSSVLTSKNHPSGSDRIAEVIRNMDVEVVVNIQGDEPMMNPEIIDKLIEEFDDPSVQMTTAVSTVYGQEDILNPNSVKVFLDEKRNAVSFQRQLEDRNAGGWYHHVGIYAYRKKTLLAYTKMPPSVSEKAHNLEQLRALDNGISIRAVITDFPFRGVDTKDDLKKLKKYLQINTNKR